MDREVTDEWQEETTRLTRVTAEIERQLDALGAAREAQQEELEDLRVFMFDSLHSASQSADEQIETAQLMQEHWQQSLAYGHAQDAIHRRRMLLSRPYFGRIDFQEASAAPETFYIGLQSLLGQHDEEWIYDWRTPIATLYYDGEPGPASYRLGQDEYAGQLTKKRQYQIEDGHLQSFFDSDVTIGDALLCELLGKSADGPMRSIVATIQREQNTAIRMDARVLVVQGTAGSGKTSVAMQRAAYLLYHYRGQMKADQIVMVSPHTLFANYVKNVLPELGEENVWQTTLHLYARRWLPPSMQIETSAQWFERLFQASESNRQDRLGARDWKGSQGFREAVLRFASHLRSGAMPFADIVYKGARILSAEAQLRVFLDAHEWTPLADRLDQVRAHAQAVLRKVEAQRARQWHKHLIAHNRYIGEEADLRNQAAVKAAHEVAQITGLIRGQAAFDACALYLMWYRDRELFMDTTSDTALSEKERERIRLETVLSLERGQIALDDVAGIMTLWQVLDREHIRSDIRHVIVDEAQDYTVHEWFVLSGLFPRARYTVLGDPGQAIGLPVSDLQGRIHTAFPTQEVHEVSLAKSYRSTRQIRDLARALGDVAVGEGLLRDGAPVQRRVYAGSGLSAWLADDVRSLEAQGHRSIALLTRTVADSERLYADLRKVLPLDILRTGNEAFHTGVVVLPVYLSKGLEFDAVLVVDVEAYRTDTDRSLLYVACTRALHILHLYDNQTAQTACPWWDAVDAQLFEKVTLT
ncbi:MAG: AAA family ATPase [Firmicutes bacterium]|nr:AAA family ATPase [Bacillota bacterium]